MPIGFIFCCLNLICLGVVLGALILIGALWASWIFGFVSDINLGEIFIVIALNIASVSFSFSYSGICITCSLSRMAGGHFLWVDTIDSTWGFSLSSKQYCTQVRQMWMPTKPEQDTKVRVSYSAESYYAAWRMGRQNHSNQQVPKISNLRPWSLLAFEVILASLIIPFPVPLSSDTQSFFLAKCHLWLKPKLGLMFTRGKLSTVLFDLCKTRPHFWIFLDSYTFSKKWVGLQKHVWWIISS